MGTLDTFFGAGPGGSAIKSIQRGTSTVPSNSSSVNVTIAAVNTAKTALSHLGSSGYDPFGNSYYPTGNRTIQLLNSTTIKLSSSYAESCFFSWEVIEYV